MIFKEGDSCEYVYLVKEGQFEQSRILPSPKEEEDTWKILENPLKCMKSNNNKALLVTK